MLKATHDAPRGSLLHRFASTVAGRVAVQPQDKNVAISIDGVVILHSDAAPNCIIIHDAVIALANVATGDALLANANFVVYKCVPAVEGTDASDATRRCSVGGFSVTPEAEQQRLLHLVDAPVRVEAYANGLQVASSRPDVVRIAELGDFGMATHAASDIPVGAEIYNLDGALIPFPTVYTLCLAKDRHLLFSCDAQCLAHSCDPTAKIVVADDAASFRVVAVKEIPSGGLISFNYLTTEWSMQEPFPCSCGAAQCFGTIAGFKHLTAEQQARIFPDATPYIHQMVSAQQ